MISERPMDVDSQVSSFLEKEENALNAQDESQDNDAGILAHEINEAMSQLKPHTAPGLIRILTIML